MRRLCDLDTFTQQGPSQEQRNVIAAGRECETSRERMLSGEEKAIGMRRCRSIFIDVSVDLLRDVQRAERTLVDSKSSAGVRFMQLFLFDAGLERLMDIFAGYRTLSYVWRSGSDRPS